MVSHQECQGLVIVPSPNLRIEVPTANMMEVEPLGDNQATVV